MTFMAEILLSYFHIAVMATLLAAVVMQLHVFRNAPHEKLQSLRQLAWLDVLATILALLLGLTGFLLCALRPVLFDHPLLWLKLLFFLVAEFLGLYPAASILRYFGQPEQVLLPEAERYRVLVNLLRAKIFLLLFLPLLAVALARNLQL